ncbi:hypothetical protein N7G274_002949 [Stereocaulon virgatum]|uniref:C2H2-type domain-containing protein n=1 Tax=Stereocaulon virgatum TaxID=373712 RepID=A0ABR4AFI3_9LECA
MSAPAGPDDSAELQQYSAFDQTIQKFCEKERSRNTLMPKEFLTSFLAYLDHVITSEAENTGFGQAQMHRRRRTILNIKRRPDGNLNFGDFMMQTHYMSKAEMHLYQGYDHCEAAYQICSDVAIVIETLAKYIQTTLRFSERDISDLKNRVADLENDVNVALGLKQDVAKNNPNWEYIKPKLPVGDGIRTLLTRATVASRKLQTTSEPSRRLASMLDVLIRDLENLLRNLAGRKLDRTMITEIELKIWSQEEQFNNLISKSGEEVTHKNRAAGDLLMPLLLGIGRTISEVLSLLGLNSSFRVPAEESPAPRERVPRTATRAIKIAKAYSPTSSSSTSTGMASLMPCTHCAMSFPSDSTLKKHVLATHTRPFVCTFHAYGCESTVGSKNEWKRHINVQHMRSETWRCDIGTCALQNCAFQPPPPPMPMPVSVPAPAQIPIVENGIASATRKRKSGLGRISEIMETNNHAPKQELESDADMEWSPRKGRKRSKTDYDKTEEPASTVLRETKTDPVYSWAAVNKPDDRRSSRKNSRIDDGAVNIAPKPDPDAEYKPTKHDIQMPQVPPYMPQHEVPPPSASSSIHPELPEPSYHEFDRKDLFTQHLKRMHAPASSASASEKSAFNDAIETVQARCHVRLRELPTNTICPFCPDHSTFKKWEDRLEHVGKHLEKQDIDLTGEIEDVALRNWMIGQGFLERGEGGWRLCELSRKKKRGEKANTGVEGDGADGEDDE